uniref:Hexosyltransferase n=1 Tax=Rhabditophanes sp. KR3021 TaxID=114890 RepID=A0AC35U1D9_9BILA
MLGIVRIGVKIGLPLVLGFVIALLVVPSEDHSIFTCNAPLKSPSKKQFIDVAEDWTVRVKKMNVTKQPNQQKGKVVRSRFAATELGIKEKLLVIILGQSSLSVALNSAIAEHVPRLHVFSDVSRIDSDMNVLQNLSPYKPNGQHSHIHILNGIFNLTFHENYDWFFILPDTTYVNPFELMRLVNSINWNSPQAIGMSDEEGKCTLQAGILLSNPAMQSLIQQRHICNTITASSDSVAFEMCIHHSTALSCVQKFQNKSFKWWKAKENNAPDSSIHQRVLDFSKSLEFNKSLTVSPLLSDLDVQSLHQHFVSVEMNLIEKEIKELSEAIENLNFEEGTPSWPIGIRSIMKPQNRYLSPTWDYFTTTEIYKNNPVQNKENLEDDDKEDVEEVVRAARKYIEKSNHATELDFEGDQLERLLTIDHTENNHAFELLEGEYDPKRLKFKSLRQGYRMFNAQRGMDYIIDLDYELETMSEMQIIPIRVRLCRPIHRTQLLNQVPYVKEDTDLTIVIGVENEKEVQATVKLLSKHASFCSSPGFDENRKTLIVIVGRDLEDKSYSRLTDTIELLRDKCKQIETDASLLLVKTSQVMIQIAAMNEAIERYGEKMVYLLLSPYADYGREFMDRVRINTIRHFQVFFPIPFAQFNPLVVNADKVLNSLKSEREKVQESFKQETKPDARDDVLFNSIDNEQQITKKILDINKGYPIIDNTKDIIVHKDFGFFDTNDFSCLSMYGSDYLAVIKAFFSKDKNNVYDLASLFNGLDDIHMLRTIEPTLKIKSFLRQCSKQYSSEDLSRCLASKKLSYGSKAQLANIVFTNMDGIPKAF